MSTVVNRANSSLHGGSLEIMLTVPFINHFFFRWNDFINNESINRERGKGGFISYMYFIIINIHILINVY